ncbi:Domain of unknown function (DUF2088) [Seminavis robusta]|uniref:LarA-like N-terminal domain-containing protein n=1 Tax=Seminavis robusta TaxID=568900 RepID=A0A9N8HFN8_9STRA|nr:Domain of unknown function (DUF2088) [Seminavis robusta]|eukprot:Sro583_g170640.1 Domain of unknown function (DUF2088) (466) ;mRNA; r:19546-21133
MPNDPASLICSVGSEASALTDDEIRGHIDAFLEKMGERDDIMIIPPDYTRFPSQAGKITQMVCEYYNFIVKGDFKQPSTADASATKSSSCQTNITILPALGTHAPMTPTQIESMYGTQLKEKDPFVVHDWRNDVVTIGHVPNQMVLDATRGMVDEPWPAQLNKIVWEKRKHDPEKQKHKSLVLSIGQVVPHEVLGMANYNKNLFVGAGGVEAINLSHFIGAVYGMEKMMGRASNPLRSILNHASEQFLQELDLWYILTVIGANESTGKLEVKGLFIGNDIECYNKACDLSLKVNFTMLDTAPSKVVVHLDKDEFHSTWLGNKAIYRTRMAIADEGELIILAPGVKRFGEDDKIDELIRKYGYVGTDTIMKALNDNPELKDNLSAVAHLIHGSSEGRFSVTYCPGHLTQSEVEGVGFKYGSLEEMSKKYPVDKLSDGWNDNVEGSGKFFFIRNPALGLWATKDRFE